MKKFLQLSMLSLIFSGCVPDELGHAVESDLRQGEAQSSDQGEGQLQYGNAARQSRLTTQVYVGEVSRNTQLYAQISNKGSQSATFIVTYMTMDHRVLRTQELHAEPGSSSRRRPSGRIFPESDLAADRIKVRVQAVFSGHCAHDDGPSRDVSFGLYEGSSSDAFVGLRALAAEMMPIDPDDAP